MKQRSVSPTADRGIGDLVVSHVWNFDYFSFIATQKVSHTTLSS